MTAAEIVDLFIQLDRNPVALVREIESRVLAETVALEQRLKIANDCCDRLMQACSDAGCPDGVRMDDWIRANVRVLAERKPVGWIIDWPDEPELGHYYSEEANDMARSRPLFTHPTPDDASQWISVNHATPKEGSRVLICQTLAAGFGHAVTVGPFFAGVLEGKFVDPWGAEPIEFVTHWMLSPEPPAAIDRARQSGEEGKS